MKQTKQSSNLPKGLPLLSGRTGIQSMSVSCLAQVLNPLFSTIRDVSQ